MKWFCSPKASGLTLSGAKLTEAVRRMRHAFLNDLQVLSGWLQLGRTAAAVEYLGRVQTRLTADSEWAALHDPDLQAALFLAKTEAEGAGLVLTARVLGEPDPAYVSAAAAAWDGSRQVRPVAGGSFAVALLAVLRSVIRWAASRAPVGGDGGPLGLEAMVSLGGGGLEVALHFPDTGSDLAQALPGLAEEALLSSGFTPCRDGADRSAAAAQGLVGLEWRAVRAQFPATRVAEGSGQGMELVMVAGLEPRF